MSVGEEIAAEHFPSLPYRTMTDVIVHDEEDGATTTAVWDKQLLKPGSKQFCVDEARFAAAKYPPIIGLK
jgi:hypothetical protein